MQNKPIFQWILACTLISASADVQIGINLQLFPNMVAVPNYPVYYVPGMNSNYFYFDGMYWVLEGDSWYSSAWYNGPWDSVDPAYVPDYVLRIPVSYYGHPPAYFGGWQGNAAPHWGEHWGGGWSQRRSGWDHWDHNAVPARTPLPVYQRQYAGNRYPAPAQQKVLQAQHPQYQPHNPVVTQHAAAKPQNNTATAPHQTSQIAQFKNNEDRATRSAEGIPAAQSRTPAAPREQPGSAERAQAKEQAPRTQIVPPPHPQKPSAPQSSEAQHIEHVQPKEQTPHPQMTPPQQAQKVAPRQEAPHEQQNHPAAQAAKREEKSATPNEHTKEEHKD